MSCLFFIILCIETVFELCISLPFLVFSPLFGWCLIGLYSNMMMILFEGLYLTISRFFKEKKRKEGIFSFHFFFLWLTKLSFLCWGGCTMEKYLVIHNLKELCPFYEVEFSRNFGENFDENFQLAGISLNYCWDKDD